MAVVVAAVPLEGTAPRAAGLDRASVRITSPLPFTIWIVRWSGFRSRKLIVAIADVAESGATTLSDVPCSQSGSLELEALGDRESRGRTAEQGENEHHRQDARHGAASLVRTLPCRADQNACMAEQREPASGAELREERKVVTTLFADLVGSTPLGERLEPEEVRLVVGEAVARMILEIERFGGRVKDLAGDGVLAFFGAPVAYEDDAERAVRAGLRIAEEMAVYAGEVERGWGVEGFGVRIGVATGPVVLGAIGAGARVEYAAFGDTVNTAARLQTAAEPGTVLADADTRRQLEPLFEWGEEQAVELKGKTAPVAASVAHRPRAEASKRRGLDGPEVDLVGRPAELAVIAEVLGAARTGSGGVVFMTGEAGIGKSRLLAEMHGLAETAGEGPQPLWLEGRCVSYGESLPYWPFRDLLREWLGAGRDEPELRLRVALRRNVDTLFPDRGDEIYPYLGALLGLTLEPDASAHLAQLSPEALQYQTFEVVATVLSRLAEDRPGRGGARGPALGRHDVGAALRAAPSPGRAGRRPARRRPAGRARPPLLAAPRARAPRVPAPDPRARPPAARRRRRGRAAQRSRRRGDAARGRRRQTGRGRRRETPSTWKSSCARSSTPARSSASPAATCFDHDV